MKNLIRSFFKKVGIIIMSDKNDIFKNTNLTDPFDIQQSFFLLKKNLIIFDVGAHYGETAFEYSARFNESKIYSFEPFIESFNILNDNVREKSCIHTFNIALGETIGTKKLNCNSFSATNSILETHEQGGAIWGDNLLETIDTTEINITTIDDFVDNQQISGIDILKIDVQGYEFNVIEGAKELIFKNGIKVIYLEIMILPTYKNQKYLEELLSLLRSYNFSLYNFYNFSYDPFGSLRNLDAIFISNVYKNVIFI